MTKPTNQDIIVALDPSSTIVGYAAMTPYGILIEAGLITPADQSAGSYDRINSLCLQVRRLLGQIRPAYCLIEWTKGKVGKRHHGLGAGLAVYGCGVGAVAATCRQWAEGQGAQVHAIIENDWTRGVPKRVRQLAIASEYTAYRIGQDPGGDAADAIGLACWWIRNNQLLELRT